MQMDVVVGGGSSVCTRRPAAVAWGLPGAV